MANNKNLPPPAAFVDPVTGLLTRQANNFLNAITASSNVAAAGDIATPAAGGLEGGGTVSDGVTLSIAPNGVANSMIRQSVGTSVIGRFQGTTGNVADIIATADNRVLGRFGGQLVFQDVTTIGVGSVTTVSVTTANGVSGSVANPTSTPAITLTLGAITPTSVAASTWIKTTPKTVATLTAAATAGAGARDFVTDALGPVFGAAVVGGGAVKIPVYSDGAAWLVG